MKRPLVNKSAVDQSNQGSIQSWALPPPMDRREHLRSTVHLHTEAQNRDSNVLVLRSLCLVIPYVSKTDMPNGYLTGQIHHYNNIIPRKKGNAAFKRYPESHLYFMWRNLCSQVKVKGSVHCFKNKKNVKKKKKKRERMKGCEFTSLQKQNSYNT